MLVLCRDPYSKCMTEELRDDGDQSEDDSAAVEGISLSELGEAYAKLMGLETSTPSEDVADDEKPAELAEATVDEEEDIPVSPEAILEAALFVGHPQNEPLTSRQLADLMRGVDAGEIHDLVAGLRDKYEQRGCPYTIVSHEDGYCMSLRAEYGSLRENFYGKVREARLSQNAIDVLAIVAYHQPIERKRIDQLRGKATGPILNQLVRRRLLRVERSTDKPRTTTYSTTQRFLDLFGLQSVSELPNSDDA